MGNPLLRPMPANRTLIADIRAAEYPWQVPGLDDVGDLAGQRLIAQHVNLAMLLRERGAGGSSVFADPLVADALIRNPTLTLAELPVLIEAWHDLWCAANGRMGELGLLVALLDERLDGWGRDVCALWEARADEQNHGGLPSWEPELVRATRCPWADATWQMAAHQAAEPDGRRVVADTLIRLWLANATLRVSDRWAFVERLVANTAHARFELRAVARAWMHAAMRGAPEEAEDLVGRWPAMALVLRDAGLLAAIARRVPACAADRRAFVDAVFVANHAAFDRMPLADVLLRLDETLPHWVAEDRSLLVTLQTHPNPAVRLWGATIGASAPAEDSARDPHSGRPLR